MQGVESEGDQMKHLRTVVLIGLSSLRIRTYRSLGLSTSIGLATFVRPFVVNTSCLPEVSMRSKIFMLFLLVWLHSQSFCQSNTVVTKITSPVQSLPAAVFGGEKGDKVTIDATVDPYKSGALTKSTALKALQSIGCKDSGTDPSATCFTNVTTIIHILRWQDLGHTKTMFDKWYIYDPTSSRSSFYIPSSAEFTGTSIPGRTNFQLVYFHLNFDLTKGTREFEQDNADNTTTLIHPVSYSVTVTKAQTQFLQDLKTVLQLANITKAAAVTAPPVGYYSIATFTSQWTTSTITISASLDSGDQNAASKTASKATDKSTQLVSQTFNNEKPTWLGLSGGVQVTSYKDITYQTASGSLAPSTVTSKNVYLFLDGYIPPVLSGLRTFRYIPHPTFGVPLKGKVLRHTMLGGAIGLKWLEPYGGVVFDTENAQVKGSTTSNRGTSLTLQPVFGLKISISAVAKAVNGKSATSSQSSTK